MRYMRYKTKMIIEKLNERNIEFLNFSTHHEDMIRFSGEMGIHSSQKDQLRQNLFSFLLENLMNRYLFNLMLRKSPNIESWPINYEEIKEDTLKKYAFNQSFIRLYKCYDCKHLLKRRYASELSEIPIDEIAECPNCGLKKVFHPSDYEPSFKILKNDLARFSNRLKEINVLKSKNYIICSKCNVEFGLREELSGLNKCKFCGGKLVHKMRNEFDDDFLNLCHSEFGLWFEWFIYEIAKKRYQYVECGLNLSYVDIDGNSKEKEVDIVALDNDKLILIECKDYIGHTSANQYNTIVEISPFFDEVYVVNSYKPHKDVKKVINDSNMCLTATMSIMYF